MTGEELRAIRERVGWTQEALGQAVADATGRSFTNPQGRVSKWERGREPVPSWVAAFVAVLSEEDNPVPPELRPVGAKGRQPRAAASDTAPVADGPDLRASDVILPSKPYAALCEEMFDLIATGVGMVGAAIGNPALQADGLIIHERKAELGAAYGKLAETNETFRAMLTQTERQGAYLAVALATGSTAGAMWRNHVNHRLASQAPRDAEEALRAARDGAIVDAPEEEQEQGFAVV